MVPLARMRTLIFLLACGALAEMTRSNTTSLLPQPPGPRQGDPDRHGTGDSPSHVCAPGVAPECTAVPVQHGMCLIIDGTAASSNSDRAVPDGRVLMSVALPFAVIFMIALGVNALITDHPREKPPRGPAGRAQGPTRRPRPRRPDAFDPPLSALRPLPGTRPYPRRPPRHQPAQRPTRQRPG